MELANVPVPRTKPTHSGFAPVRLGGYIFEPASRFRVSRDGRFVTNFETRALCGARIILPTMRIGPGRQFGYRGTVRSPSGRRAIVRVSGTFVDAITVGGTVRVRANGHCDSGTRRYVAHLS